MVSEQANCATGRLGIRQFWLAAVIALVSTFALSTSAGAVVLGSAYGGGAYGGDSYGGSLGTAAPTTTTTTLSVPTTSTPIPSASTTATPAAAPTSSPAGTESAPATSEVPPVSGLRQAAAARTSNPAQPGNGGAGKAGSNPTATALESGAPVIAPAGTDVPTLDSQEQSLPAERSRSDESIKPWIVAGLIGLMALAVVAAGLWKRRDGKLGDLK